MEKIALTPEQAALQKNIGRNGFGQVLTSARPGLENDVRSVMAESAARRKLWYGGEQVLSQKRGRPRAGVARGQKTLITGTPVNRHVSARPPVPAATPAVPRRAPVNPRAVNVNTINHKLPNSVVAAAKPSTQRRVVNRVSEEATKGFSRLRSSAGRAARGFGRLSRFGKAGIIGTGLAALGAGFIAGRPHRSNNNGYKYAAIDSSRTAAFDEAMKKLAGTLTVNGRKHIKEKNYALPEQKKYPIHDMAHARNALARVSAYGSPAQQSEVRSAVYEKYPSLKK